MCVMDNRAILDTYGTTLPEAALVLRYCLYARKSSEAEERQAMSVDSQVKEMLNLATKDGIYVVEVYRESHSAKDCGMRPVFNELLNDIRIGKFNAILVWHPDRLSRKALLRKSES